MRLGKRAGVRAWTAALAALVLVRWAIPLAALAASGRALPDLPRYRYAPLNGDSFGYYAAAREFMATPGQLGAVHVGGLAVALAACAVVFIALWRRRLVQRWLVAVLAAFALAGACAVVVAQMRSSGAPVVGWPILWSLPMIPYRAVGGHLDPDVAFGFGFALSLLLLGVALVATAYLGLYATGRRSVGIGAAALFAAWPLVTGVLAGDSAWRNGQWHVDVGLHLYTEPLSTALVTVALVALLAPAAGSGRLALAGLLLGYAATVKLSNGVLAAALLPLVFARWRLRGAAAYAAAAVAPVPIALAYWPKASYGLDTREGGFPERPFGLDYVVHNWTASLMFKPHVLLILLPLLALGLLTIVDRLALGVLAALIAVNAVFYSFYALTWEHPRFLYVALPGVFVLEAAGAVLTVRRLAAVRLRAAAGHR